MATAPSPACGRGVGGRVAAIAKRTAWPPLPLPPAGKGRGEGRRDREAHRVATAPSPACGRGVGARAAAMNRFREYSRPRARSWCSERAPQGNPRFATANMLRCKSAPDADLRPPAGESVAQSTAAQHGEGLSQTRNDPHRPTSGAFRGQACGERRESMGICRGRRARGLFRLPFSARRFVQDRGLAQPGSTHYAWC